MDLKQLKKSELSYSSFTLLQLLVEEKSSILDYIVEKWNNNFLQDIQILEDKGYIKVMEDNNIELRERTRKLFNLDKEDVKDWINQWRNIFPKLQLQGKYPARGNLAACIENMKQFIKTYKKKKEEILLATEKYVKKFERTGYEGMRQAHYFIKKQGVGSDLLTEIENLENKEDEIQSTNKML